MKFLYLIVNQRIDEPVVEYASEVVAKTDGSLDILVVSNDKEQQQITLEDLERIKGNFADIELKVTAEVGDPVDQMKAAIERENYDMVLMAVPRRRRLFPSQFRFISHRIIKHCPVPILLIRRVSENLNRILICTGGKEISEPVVKLSSKLAGAAHLKATVLNVASAVPSMYTGIEEMDEGLETILEADTPLAQHLRLSAELLEKHQVEAEIKVKHGDVVEAILEEVDTGNYDLVVMGKPSEDTLIRLLLGNVTQQIVNRAASAVLIVK